MSVSLGKFVRRSAAGAAATALMLGATVVPAQANVVDDFYRSAVAAPFEISSMLPPEVSEAIFPFFAFPVIASSILSSVIGIEQCGLHDTRACRVARPAVGL